MQDTLTAALERILDRAERAQASLDAGRAVNGRTALAQIETEARDALRHHAEDLTADGAGRFEHAAQE